MFDNSDWHPLSESSTQVQIRLHNQTFHIFQTEILQIPSSEPRLVWATWRQSQAFVTVGSIYFIDKVVIKFFILKIYFCSLLVQKPWVHKSSRSKVDFHLNVASCVREKIFFILKSWLSSLYLLTGLRDVAPLYLRHPHPLLHPGLAQHLHLQEVERAGCLAEENWPETSEEERDEIR